MRTFENRPPRRIFGRKSEKLAEGWRKFRDQLHRLFFLPDTEVTKSSRIGMDMACRTHRRGEKCKRENVGRREGKKHLEDIGNGWEDTIKMDL